MSSRLTNRLVAGLPPMMMMPPVTASNASSCSTRAAWLFSIWLIGLSVWSPGFRLRATRLCRPMAGAGSRSCACECALRHEPGGPRGDADATPRGPVRLASGRQFLDDPALRLDREQQRHQSADERDCCEPDARMPDRDAGCARDHDVRCGRTGPPNV